MTKLLAVFRPRVALRIPSCPDPLIDLAVIDSAIAFCEKSTVLRRLLDRITTVANVATYDVDMACDTKLVLIHRAWCDDREISATVEEDAVFPVPAAATMAPLQVGRPQALVFTEPGTIGLFPVPDTVYTISMRVSLAPTRDADSVEDELYDDWVEGIVAGAVSRLYLTPEFMNAGFAAAYDSIFESEVRSALVQSNRGRIVAEQRIRFPHI